MERYARRVPGGGIAWENTVFDQSAPGEAVRLVDAAVDIAWERLLADRSPEEARLAINRQGRLLVFRAQRMTARPLAASRHPMAA